MERIEQYMDYRAFLRDFYEARKKQFRFFSYRFFCKKAGINSPSLFREVADGKRNLSKKNIAQFIKGLELNETDGRYFFALVNFNQSKTAAEKQSFLDQMRGLKRRVRQAVLPADHYAFYTRWYHTALRELACLLDWRDDYNLLAKCISPRITPHQAREGMKLLLDLGLLAKTPSGRYRQTDPALTTGPEVVSPAVRELNRQMAELGEKAIQAHAPSRRDISSLCVGISENSYRLIKQEIQEFKARVIRIVDDDALSDQVYNLNVQLFPLSEKNEDAPVSQAEIQE